MGRRALPKIDPALDLSEHLKTLDDLPNPWDPIALFSRRAPLEVEVGSGKGLFLRTASAALPEHDFLGIEVSKKYARFAASRLARDRRPNARVVAGDALWVFRELLPAASVVAVHVYFPDPWWKKRHRRRRVMNESFLHDAERVLQPGGRFYFWTDVSEYFEEALQLIAEATSLCGPTQAPQREAEHDLDYRTHFERRMRLSGEPVYRAEYSKSAT